MTTTTNTPTTFGSVTRTLHWLTALLILTAIPLGLIANQLPASPDSIVLKTQLFSLHKTVGIAAFLVAFARILWALGQQHPAPLHPERRAEITLAAIIHWLLYISMLVVPLSGWIHHAALTGFAPILWPLGQDLPFIPKSESVAAVFGTTHWVFTKLLAASVLLHIAGALKHHLIDRDATLARMTKGVSAPAQPQHSPRRRAPLIAALAIYSAGATLAYGLLPNPATAPATAQSTESTSGNWQVSTGSLGFEVQQMGAAVTGSFANWTADISFSETLSDGKHGQVTVTIDLASLTLGSVTDQAKGPEFFDVATHPTATFTADILPATTGYAAQGTLTLHGVAQPSSFPFALQINGDTATMQASMQLDRRDFGIGATYTDESTVGFGVTVQIDLTAQRK
jgi:cytochrome b561/polyisoprenoid-binding protein YceI